MRFLLCINDKFLTWSDLKRFVIDKSVNEINNKSDLNISYEPKKIGRSFTDIEFFIDVDPDANFLENKLRAEFYLGKIKMNKLTKIEEKINSINEKIKKIDDKKKLLISQKKNLKKIL
ncbi:replication initiation protein [Gilliamella sp. App6-5]|uniref:replication initiation protein n=1 Tax=Gilliamella sp. App6-5 TaxID=3120232 RepID=UPI0026852D6F